MMDKEDPPIWVHMENHLQLQEQHIPKDVRWVIPALTEAQLFRVGMLAGRIYEANQDGQIPFGFTTGNTRFEESGRFAGDGDRGLSCAGFVTVLFRSAALPLVEEQSWAEPAQDRRAEDQRDRENILHFIRQDHPRRATALESELEEPIRVRPAEIAAAFGMNPRPVSFGEAEIAGKFLLSQFNEKK